MSNVKQIRIQGELDTLALMAAPESIKPRADGLAVGIDLVNGHNIPADKVELAIAAAKRLNRFLAATTLPHFGLKVAFENAPCRLEKNGRGGQIYYFRYTITGEEAIPWESFEELVAGLAVFGKVYLRACRDIEN